jgi:branched-chain amino acid transport system permease protein
MEFLIMQSFYGFSYGALLFILSCGFTLIFGVMKFVNMAHASFYLLGGYAGITLLRWIGCTTASFILSIIVAAITIGFLGIFIQRVFCRGLFGQDLPQVLLTLGFALMFDDLVLVVWGGDPVNVAVPAWLKGTLTSGSYHLSIYRFFMISTAIVVAVGLWVLLEKTSFGARIRATADDEEMAGGVGIKIPLVSACVFGLAAALAAIAGVVGGGFLSLYPGAGLIMLPLAVAVVIIGGLGRIKGAAAASLLLGLMDSFGKAFFPEFAYFTMYLPMVIILAVRPTGLFGKA